MTTLRPWLLAASLLCGLPAGAATRYVDDGNCPGPGTGTTADPYCSIQLAFNAANLTGDTIVVRPGTYTECLDATPKSVVLQAENADPSLTILDGFSCLGTSTLTIGDGSTVSGFWMTGGSEGAIFALNGITLTNNIITTNGAQGAGGGIFVETDPSIVAGPTTIAITIENNSIQNNTSDREGGGIWMSATASGTVDVVAQITGNTISGNHSSGVGGGIGLLTHAGPGASVTVSIDNNIFQTNVVDSPPLSNVDGYGGAIWLSTSGPGDESVSITGNTIGPALGVNDNSLKNTATKNGGGISATVLALDTARHSLFIEKNTVRRNTADLGGGGIDLFVDGENLDLPSNPTPGRYSVLVYDNDIDGNTVGIAATPDLDFGYGGGMLTVVTTAQTVSRRNPTDIVGNRITNNTASQAGGGASTWVFADAGPTSFTAAALRHNTVTNNSAINGNSQPDLDAWAGGLELFLQAAGAGTARIDTKHNTITGNSTEIGGGGIDISAIATTLSGNAGTTLAEIANSVIENNTCSVSQDCGYAVGYPPDPIPPFPGVFRLTLRSSDLSPNEGGTVEPTLAAHRVDVCMPAATAAALAFPGVDSDDDVDGIDLLRMATAFASSPGTIHYNPLTDLNGDLVVDGVDLATLGASFGDTCP
ncbi:MAG TPA: hypothetical protein VFO11_09240 [Candidatus Polarisedimenticolaceae bacterium]|nr:hypothetical protein [Candidatus Polarisedimenticolaceae bacterium]